MLRLAGLILSLGLLSGCLHIKLEPIEVRHTLNVNVKVDRALDDFFGDLDKKSTTINPETAK